MQKVVVLYNRTLHATYFNIEAHANIAAVCTHVLCTDYELHTDCHCTDCSVTVTYDYVQRHAIDFV